MKKYKVEIGIILLLQSGFLIVQLLFKNYFHAESAEYLQTATNLISSGEIYSGNPNSPVDLALNTKVFPGYPIFISLRELFNGSLVPLLILQLLISFGSFLLLLKIFQPEQKSTLFILCFAAIFPAQFIYPNLIMPEILLQFILMLAFLTIWKYIESERISLLWLYQGLIIISILIQPSMALFAIPNSILFIVLYFRTRQRLVFISSLIPIVFLIIISGINQQRTGYYHLSTSRQISLVDQKLFTYLSESEGPEAASQTIKKMKADCKNSTNLKKYSTCLSRTVMNIIKENPSRYTLFYLKGISRFFLDPGRAEFMYFFQKNNNIATIYPVVEAGWIMGPENNNQEQALWISLLLITILIINILRLAGFVFFLFNAKVKREFRLFLLFLILTLAFSAGPLGSARYMLPVFFMLSGAAIFQYSQWFTKLRARRKAAGADAAA